MYLSVIFDVVAILIFVFCIITCAKKGFIGSSYKILSIILAIVLMFLFQDTISQYIKDSAIGKRIESAITDSLTEKFNDTKEVQPKEDEEKGFLQSLGLPKLYEKIFDNKNEEIELAKAEIISKTSKKITLSVINILSVILLYILIRIILYLLFKLTSFVFKLPILNTANKLLGAGVGAVQGLLIIYVICSLLVWFIPKQETTKIYDAIEQSVVTKYFYDNNLLLELFM